MCTYSNCHVCGRIAYGYSYSDCIRHAHSHFCGDANQYPCANGIGHTYAGADFDADAHRLANTCANSNLYTSGDTYPNANSCAPAEPDTGRRARHRLFPCQRDRG